MLLAFFLAAASAANWIPMRWSSADPQTLDLLKGTPVNCLLLEERDWSPAFLKAAAARNIATVASIPAGERAAELARRAAAFEFNAAALEGEYDPALGDHVRAALAGKLLIELPVRRRMRLDSRDPILGTSQGLWPGIEIEHGGKVMTGPSSTPWIYTNTGFLRFVRSATEASLWIGVRPPPGNVYPPSRYAVAIADAEIAGARWIIALDSDLERSLMRQEPAAVAAWKQIAPYLSYYENNAEWRSWRPFSVMAVVQDSASGGMLSSSLLDMLSTQHTSVRPIPTHRLGPDTLRGARVVLDIDAESVSAQQKQALDDFVSSGGVLVNPPKGWKFPATPELDVVPGKGQQTEIGRMWEVAYGATARKNFGARTFNTASILYNLLAAPDNRGMLIHLVNYTDFPAETVAVQVLGDWKKATLYQPGLPARTLEVYPVKDGSGVDVDKISIAATLRFE